MTFLLCVFACEAARLSNVVCVCAVSESDHQMLVLLPEDYWEPKAIKDCTEIKQIARTPAEVATLA